MTLFFSVKNDIEEVRKRLDRIEQAISTLMYCDMCNNTGVVKLAKEDYRRPDEFIKCPRKIHK